MLSGRRRNYKHLILWQKAVALATDIHRLTGQLRRHEIYGLGSQMRRSAVSIPSNVAEGAARRTTREFIAFLHIARGSFDELETQLRLSRKIGYLTDSSLAPILGRLDEVGRLPNAVIVGLRRDAHRSFLPPLFRTARPSAR
jgi:four helix bundle protein